MSSIDPKLAQRVMQGDQGALVEVLEAQQQRLYNIVLRMVGNRDDAAELTQEALLKIVQHIGDFRGKSLLTTWMTRIAMNLAVSFLRKASRRGTMSLDQTLHDGAGGAASLAAALADHREPEPARGVERQEELAAVLAGLARLDEDHRAVLVLRDIDAMDYQQIATVLAMPVGTVKSRLFRARLALRREIAQPGQPGQSGRDAVNPSGSGHEWERQA